MNLFRRRLAMMSSKWSSKVQKPSSYSLLFVNNPRLSVQSSLSAPSNISPLVKRCPRALIHLNFPFFSQQFSTLYRVLQRSARYFFIAWGFKLLCRRMGKMNQILNLSEYLFLLHLLFHFPSSSPSSLYTSVLLPQTHNQHPLQLRHTETFPLIHINFSLKFTFGDALMYVQMFAMRNLLNFLKNSQK